MPHGALSRWTMWRDGVGGCHAAILCAGAEKASGMAGINARMLERRRVFPDDGLFKVNTVVEIIDVGKSTWFDWVKAGFAPQPIKIGCNTFWRGKDIWRFIEEVSDV